MKRELIADLNGDLYAAFDDEVARFVADIGARVERVAGGAGRARRRARRPRARTEAARRDRPRARVQPRRDPARDDARGRSRARARRRPGDAHRSAQRTLCAREPRRTARIRRRRRCRSTPPRAAAGDPGRRHFDPHTYEHGLRPERWRVAVIGAFKRGKSSLINALAGTRVLPDEGARRELRFPVHVRYGPVPRASTRSPTMRSGTRFRPRRCCAAALRTPAAGRDAVGPAARTGPRPRPAVRFRLPAGAKRSCAPPPASASEILALFSRQLSDRELDLYGSSLAVGQTDDLRAHDGRQRNPSRSAYMSYCLPTDICKSGGSYRNESSPCRRANTAAWNELGALRATLVSPCRGTYGTSTTSRPGTRRARTLG